jgi:hypothetical protein
MPDNADEPLSCIVVMISLPASAIERLLHQWQARDPEFIREAAELGIVSIELFDHTHDEPDSAKT